MQVLVVVGGLQRRWAMVNEVNTGKRIGLMKRLTDGCSPYRDRVNTVAYKEQNPEPSRDMNKYHLERQMEHDVTRNPVTLKYLPCLPLPPLHPETHATRREGANNKQIA